MKLLLKNEQARLVSGVGAVALGIVFILLAELVHWEWTRILGAITISIGGLGIGVAIGLADPGRYQLVRWLGNRWAIAGILVALVLVLPLLVSLLGAFAGLADDAGSESGSSRVIVGVVIGAFLLAGTAGSLWIGIRAFRRAEQIANPPEGQQLQGESES